MSKKINNLPAELPQTLYAKVRSAKSGFFAEDDDSSTIRATVDINDMREWTDKPQLVGIYQLVRKVTVANMVIVEDAE